MGQTVPFVGCPADGQAGPVATPKGSAVRVAVPARAAAQLAYYKGGRGTGVLAPRGWKCFESYGSRGNRLVVRPGPVGFGEDVAGPAVVADYRTGGGSGRFVVAEVVAQVFPRFHGFVDALRQEGALDLPTGPVPTDVLRRCGDRAVAYRTPGATRGLGTQTGLRPDAEPIDGVVALAGDVSAMVRVNTRLPERLRGLAPLILGEAVPAAVCGAGNSVK